MDPLDPSDPRVVASYRLLGRLGVGGKGQVYLAVSPARQRVALKVILRGLAQQDEFRRRFRREVRAARAVRGRYVAEVVDADPESNPPWLATQYVAGPSLAQAVRRCGPLPPPAAAAIGAATVTALLAVERAGLVHRDLKPPNILLDIDGPRVIDFGIAKAAEESHLTQTGMVIGTPGFMAPEQIDGVPLTAAADVFSLGAVLVFTLTGAGPFGEGTPRALIGRILYKEPELDGVPEQWRGLLGECLAKDPAARPPLSTLVGRLVPDGRPVEALFGPGWLPEQLGGYVQEHTDIVDRRAGAAGAGPGPAGPPPVAAAGAWSGAGGAFAPGRAGVAGPPSPTVTGSSWPAGHPAVTPDPARPSSGQRRRWPIVAAVAALAILGAVAMPFAVAQLAGPSPEETDGRVASPTQPGSGGATPGAGDSGDLPDGYAGVWSGEVAQANRDGTYPVQVSLAGGSVGSTVGTVRYWTLACAGELRLESVADDHLRLTERITEGVENCVELVPMRLDLDRDSLAYLASPGEASHGEGTLTRSTVVLPVEFTGAWEGDVYQASIDEEYPVALRIRDRTVGRPAGSIRYPSLQCGGELRLEQVAGEIAWFTETITTNERFPGCTPTGAVSLALTGDSTATYRYFEDPRDLTDPAVEGPVRRS